MRAGFPALGGLDHSAAIIAVLSTGKSAIRNAGKSVSQVFEDYQAFVAKIHAKLPETDIFFIGLSPSIKRWQQADKEKELNGLVKNFVTSKPHLKYIETWDMVLGADGKPRKELFVADELHFSDAGNKLLAEKVRPHLPK